MPNKLKLIVLLLAVAVAGVWFYQGRKNGDLLQPETIRVSGNIEVTDAELSFKIPGRVAERLVTEGEIVKTGQVVARLDSSELEREAAVQKAGVRRAEAELQELLNGSRPEEIEQARAAADKARSYLEQLLAGSRPQEIASAEAEVERLKSETNNFKVEYERQGKLVEEGFSSRERLDNARTRFETTAAQLKTAEEKSKLVKEGPRKEEIEQARAASKEADERFALVKAGPRKETIEQARARLQQSKATLALAETRLGYATLYSPISGVTLSKNIEPGEYVSAGTPVVTAADLQDIWLRAYIAETDLGRVKLGQKARVTTDTYPGKIYDGQVTFIASEAEFTPKNVQTEKERVKLMYRVKITLSNPRLELKAGMPADAEIVAPMERK
ncbi:MAG: efflux RND transporter periplasmic adaptor subunit [Nitrospinae bacterium]|nr:efflux RND transporter periplasmic adaptor subunit [Nitrospinota bacterium]